MPPFHEKFYHEEGATVYHNNQDCPVGSGISYQDRIPGPGDGLKLCETCIRLRNPTEEDEDEDEEF